MIDDPLSDLKVAYTTVRIVFLPIYHDSGGCLFQRGPRMRKRLIAGSLKLEPYYSAEYNARDVESR
jgi:hypothetical protein